uniref:DOMON domain-containing protein n=1 Tax=Prasinoderma singulare TaxID=676789 RepID=A0A7S3FJ11_9VIRI
MRRHGLLLAAACVLAFVRDTRAAAPLTAERVDALAAGKKVLWKGHAWAAWERNTTAGEITIVLVAKSAGWISLGWHHDALTDEMHGVDLFMAHAGSAGHFGDFGDFFSVRNRVPVRDSTCSSGSEDYLATYVSFDAASGLTTAAFTRTMAAPDQFDLPLGVEDEWTRLIVAYEPGASGDFTVIHSHQTRQDHVWANFYTGEVCPVETYHECRPDRSPPGQEGTPLPRTRPIPKFECVAWSESGGGEGGDAAAAPPPPPPAPAASGDAGGGAGDDHGDSKSGGGDEHTSGGASKEGNDSKSGGGSGAVTGAIVVVVLGLAAVGGYAAYKWHRRRRYMRMTRAFMLSSDSAFAGEEVLGGEEPISTRLPEL